MKEKIKAFIKETATGLGGFVKVIISVSLMICMFYGSYNYLSDKFDTSDIYDGSDFRALPKNSLDIISFGSSHNQYSYSPFFMYQDTGLYSYNMGSACQTFAVTYEMLKEALKTQKPELIIIESFTATPSRETCSGDSCYILAGYQMTGQERLNTLNMLDEEKAKTYYNTFINDHNNWKNNEDLSNLLPKEVEISSRLGFQINAFKESKNNWYAKTYSSTEEVELYEEDLVALENIYNLCQEKDIEILFYMVPHENVSEQDQAYRYKLWEWADEHEINHLDYIDQQKDIEYRLQLHSDGFHSYVSGASIITGNLAEYVTENYEFKNHRDNEKIDELLIEAEKKYIIDCLDAEHDPELYLRRLQNYEGEIIVRYIAGKQEITNEMLEMLHKIGVSNNFDRNKNYFAIISGGKIVIESSEYICTNDADGNYFEIGEDIVFINDTVVDKYDPLTIVTLGQYAFKNNVKHIARVEYNWKYNYKDYWDRGYNRFYNAD